MNKIHMLYFKERNLIELYLCFRNNRYSLMFLTLRLIIKFTKERILWVKFNQFKKIKVIRVI